MFMCLYVNMFINVNVQHMVKYTFIRVKWILFCNLIYKDITKFVQCNIT